MAEFGGFNPDKPKPSERKDARDAERAWLAKVAGEEESRGARASAPVDLGKLADRMYQQASFVPDSIVVPRKDTGFVPESITVPGGGKMPRSPEEVIELRKQTQADLIAVEEFLEATEPEFSKIKKHVVALEKVIAELKENEPGIEKMKYDLKYYKGIVKEVIENRSERARLRHSLSGLEIILSKLQH